MAFVFIPTPSSAVAAQVKVDPGVGAAMAEVGEEMLAEAKNLAPVETGALRDSLRVERIEDNGVAVTVNVDYWLFPEYGTVNMDAQPYLRPTLTAVGASVT